MIDSIKFNIALWLSDKFAALSKYFDRVAMSIAYREEAEEHYKNERGVKND